MPRYHTLRRYSQDAGAISLIYKIQREHFLRPQEEMSGEYDTAYDSVYKSVYEIPRKLPHGQAQGTPARPFGIPHFIPSNSSIPHGLLSYAGFPGCAGVRTDAPPDISRRPKYSLDNALGRCDSHGRMPSGLVHESLGALILTCRAGFCVGGPETWGCFSDHAVLF